jgi:hypothetical protein
MSKRSRISERQRHALTSSGCAALMAGLLLQAPSAHADPTPASDPPLAEGSSGTNASLDLARSVAVTGREAFNAGDYETALALFRRAYTLYPAPTVVLYEARSLEKLGRLLEAVEAYARTTQTSVGQDAPAQFAEAIAQAHQEERSLRARIPTLTLKVAGVSPNDPNLKVTMNGRAIGAAQLGQAQRLNPGTYRIAGSISPDRTDHSELKLAEGQNVAVVLNLAAPSPTPPAPVLASVTPVATEAHSTNDLRVYAYVAGGVGVAGLGTGLVTGLMSASKHSEADRLCPNHLCTGANVPSAVNSFRSLRTVSTVFYGVGAAGLAAGVVLWLVSAPDTTETPRARGLEPWSDARSAGVQGTF